MKFEQLSLKNDEELCTILRHYLELFPERVDTFAKDHWSLTQRLEEDGARIADGTYSDVSMYVLFLIEVAIWKNPHGKEMMDTIRYIVSNNAVSVENVFKKALDVYKRDISGKESLDIEKEELLINSFGELKGLGAAGGSRKIVSAVLRFLDPNLYGTVDFRNWMILSNTDGKYFEEALLPPLAGNVEDSKKVTITTEGYLDYLGVIREIGSICDMSPAEVDMTLFSFSHEVIPLRLATHTSDTDKAQAILSIIEEIVDGATTGTPEWVSNAAKGLLRNMERHAEKGNYVAMYRYCENLLRKGGGVGEYLKKAGKKSIESEFERIKKIYYKP